MNGAALGGLVDTLGEFTEQRLGIGRLLVVNGAQHLLLQGLQLGEPILVLKTALLVLTMALRGAEIMRHESGFLEGDAEDIAHPYKSRGLLGVGCVPNMTTYVQDISS
jgi:hypothetical protein